MTRKAPIADLFSNERREFYDEHAPAGLAIETLAVLGPIPILKVKMKPQGFGHKLVVELWMYPDDSQIVELSTKSAPEEAFQVGAEMRTFLLGLGVDLTADQQTKTKTALEFLSAP